MKKFTNNCESPIKKMEELKTKMTIVGTSLRKSLAVFRKKIEQRVYSLYCKSVNSANIKKTNSFLMFVTNLKQFLRFNSGLLEGCVVLYAELFDHVDQFTNGKTV